MVDRREKIARLAQSKEDEVLLARVYERITLAAQRNVPASTCFLSKREQMLCQELLRGEDFRFFGGTELSEREVCCYLPEYLDESWLYSADGPIAAVRASFFENDKLTHRDFLGSLMGSGIKRETVGDIYVGEGSFCGKFSPTCCKISVPPGGRSFTWRKSSSPGFTFRSSL